MAAAQTLGSASILLATAEIPNPPPLPFAHLRNFIVLSKVSFILPDDGDLIR
jgi:hypothetical protein